MTSEAQKKAVVKYEKENVRSVRLPLNKKTDTDILEWLDVQDSKIGAIKSAIREQIKKEKNA